MLLLESAELVRQVCDRRAASVTQLPCQSPSHGKSGMGLLELRNKPVLSRGVGGGSGALSVSRGMVDVRWLVQARSLSFL